MNDNPNELTKLKEYQERLNRVFQYYCLFGEPLNTNKLKSSKYLKLLRDSGMLLKGVLKIQGDQKPFGAIENIN